MNGIEMIEQATAWIARNALVTLLPAVVIAWVCWMRLGSARVRWILVGLLLLKLVTPSLPGWSWTVPGLRDRVSEKTESDGLSAGFVSQGSNEEGALFELGEEPTGAGLPWWALAWAMGVCGFGGLWVIEVWRVNRVIRTQRVAASARLLRMLEEECRFMGVSDCPEVCVLRGWGQAAVHGCWRARLLLPATWVRDLGEEELRAVLRHELAHVRRKDVLWSTLGYAVAAVHWFHPLGWLGLRRLRAEAELLCDEAALTGQGEAERKEYGRVLIRMMETFSSSPPNAVAAFARHRNDIQHRILMIAQPNRAQRWSRAMTWLILPLLSLALLTAGEKESPKSEIRNPKEGAREGGNYLKGGNSIAGVVNGHVITKAEIEREVKESGGRLSEEEALQSLTQKEIDKVDRDRNGSREREGADFMPREGEATQRVAPREGESPKSETRKPREGDRDGDRPKEGQRDGDKRREGARDGDRPKGGARDGDKPREGARDGDRPREGARDGEKPREGARDGDRPKEGMREGDRGKEGERGKEGMREGDRGKEGAREGARGKEGMREGEGGARSAVVSSKAQPMIVQLNAAGEVVNSEGRVIPDAEVKERLTQLARSRPGQEIVLKGEKETRYEGLTRVLNLLQGIDVKPTLGQ